MRRYIVFALACLIILFGSQATTARSQAPADSEDLETIYLASGSNQRYVVYEAFLRPAT
jgi:hypothetical protein